MPGAIKTQSTLIRIDPDTPLRLDRLWLGTVRVLYDVLRTVRRLRQRSRERNALAELDDHMLNDIGLTREQALRESRKWSWE